MYDFVSVGGMSRPPKPVAPLKKVAPPAVPDAGFRHSGSSFGSAGYSSAGEDHVFHDPNRGKLRLGVAIEILFSVKLYSRTKIVPRLV